MNAIAMIPARIGSTRLPKKNLALLGGRPLISYAIEAAKSAGVFSRVIVNADDEVFGKIAREWGVEFYLRPSDLGSSTAKSDHVAYDFMRQFPSDILAWINPIAPLQTASEVREALEHFQKEKLDTLITVKNEQAHAVFNGGPVNFRTDEVFAQTQDLTPVQTFVYSVMMWRSSTFISSMKKNGHALLSGRVGYFPVSKATSLIIKTQEDLMMAESLLTVRRKAEGYSVRYHEYHV